jgi:hypothetical protein
MLVYSAAAEVFERKPDLHTSQPEVGQLGVPITIFLRTCCVRFLSLSAIPGRGVQ